MSYPLHYQDVFVDTFYNTSGTWTAYSTHTADGYGDVILPGGTVSNVLRTHEYTYIVYPTDTTYENFYSWMKPGVHWNVCQYGEIHTSTQVLNTFFNYLDPVASGIADLNDSKNVSCYPNPFHNNLSVTVKNKNYREVSFTIKNTLNQTVFSNQNNFSSSPLKSIDPGFLPNGIYLLEINIDEERIVKKIVKQ